ncbi:hypothetical protein ACW7BC_05600 [Azospirillum argentinense]
MSFNMIPKWEGEGFREQPKTYEATGSQFLFRAYSSTWLVPRDTGGFEELTFGSRRIANCFFVFSHGDTFSEIRNPISINKSIFTVHFLESELNAALWGNTYKFVGQFSLKKGTIYCIGPIGQTTRGFDDNKITNNEGVIMEDESRTIGGNNKKDVDQTLFESAHNGYYSNRFFSQVKIADSRNLKYSVKLIKTYNVTGCDRLQGGRSALSH